MKKVPLYIAIKLQSWVENVEYLALSEIRKIPGFHDEPLKGERDGQRSIRLSRGYRAISVIDNDTKIIFIEVIEVNKHDY